MYFLVELSYLLAVFRLAGLLALYSNTRIATRLLFEGSYCRSEAGGFVPAAPGR